MRIHERFPLRTLLTRVVSIAGVAALGTGLSSADGPVGPGSLPGGVNVFDSDPGSGEQWGRAGGRDMQFTVLDPSSFGSLSWGAVGAGAVGLAFDGAINAVGETMSLNVVESNLAGGVAVWTGTATLPLAVSSALVLPTRFVLTVLDGAGNPALLASVAGGNQPGLDVLAANGSFQANLRFEALHNGSFGIPAGWTPALDLFDTLQTLPGQPPGQGGPVISTFNSGFFFDVTQQGLGLEEHDDNMFTQTNMIKTDLAFLTTDAINRLQQLSTGHQEIRDGVSGNRQVVLEAISQLAASIPEIPPFPTDFATPEQVREAGEQITDVLLILFGIAPCPPDAPGCPEGEFLNLFASPENLDMVKNDVQTLLDEVARIQEALATPTDAPEIDVQVVDASHGRAGRWLFTTTVDGQLVDASLVRSVAVTVHKGHPASTQDVTMLAVPASVGPGLLDVSVPLDPPFGKLAAMQFDFFFDDGTLVAHGSVLVDAKPGGDDDDD